MSGQRTRPSKLRFQRASCFPNDLLGPFRLEEPRRLREAQERITQREVGEGGGGPARQGGTPQWSVGGSDPLDPVGREEPRRLREAQERITQREVGEDAGVQYDERCTRHGWSGISTRSYRPAFLTPLPVLRGGIVPRWASR